MRQRSRGAIGSQIAFWPQGSRVLGVMGQLAGAVTEAIAGIIILMDLHCVPSR